MQPLSPHEVTYSQVPEIRMWAFEGTGFYLSSCVVNENNKMKMEYERKISLRKLPTAMQEPSVFLDLWIFSHCSSSWSLWLFLICEYQVWSCSDQNSCAGWHPKFYSIFPGFITMVTYPEISGPIWDWWWTV